MDKQTRKRRRPAREEPWPDCKPHAAAEAVPTCSLSRVSAPAEALSTAFSLPVLMAASTRYSFTLLSATTPGRQRSWSPSSDPEKGTR